VRSQLNAKSLATPQQSELSMRLNRLMQAIVVLIASIAGDVRARAQDVSVKIAPEVAIFAALRDFVRRSPVGGTRYRASKVGR
jgi:hypothetical protein